MQAAEHVVAHGQGRFARIVFRLAYPMPKSMVERSQGVRDPEEMVLMVHKEPCPTCKGNRYVTVQSTAGQQVHKKCPTCGGNGYTVRLQR